MKNHDSSSRMLKHTSLYGIGSIARNIVGFIMLPIYTTHLSPADYGAVSLIMFALSLIELLFGARLGHALPKFFHDRTSPRERNTLISSALYLMVSVSITTTIVLMLFQATASQLLFGTEAYAGIIAIFAALLVGQTIETHALDFIRLQKKPLLFLCVNLAKLVLQIALNVWLIVFENLGLMGLAIASATSTGISALLLLLYSTRKAGVAFSYPDIKLLFLFSWPMWVGGIAGLYIGSSNRYYIRLFSSIDDVGI